MAIQVDISTVTGGSEEAGWATYYVKEHLKTVGWTVAGSSDGTTGGMDATDRITSGAFFSGGTDRWIVLQSPHVNVADRVQILFDKYVASGTAMRVSYNPNADYVDAAPTTDAPTSSYATALLQTTVMQVGVDHRVHTLADDAAPYGFAFMASLVGSVVPRYSVGLVPLDSEAPLTPGKPYIVYGAPNGSYEDSSVFTETTSTVIGHCLAERGPSPSAPDAAPACIVYNNLGQLVPLNHPPDENGEDISSPIIFQATDYYYGVSDFMRWNGSARNDLDTLEDGTGLRGRIVFGDVNFPWDGTTVPVT